MGADYGYGGLNQSGGMGSSTGTSYGAGGAYSGMDNDMSGAMQHAQQHAGPSGDSSIFSNALGMLSGNKQNLQHEPLNEQEAVQAHQSLYGGGGSSSASSGMVGSAAAMQALKMFGGGGGSSNFGQSGGMHSGGGAQNQFVGMAMAQASKLFDQQSSSGNVVSYPVFYIAIRRSAANVCTGPGSQQARCSVFSSPDGHEDVYEKRDERRWNGRWWFNVARVEVLVKLEYPRISHHPASTI